MRRGWLRRNRLTTTLPYTIRCAGGFGLLQVTNQAYFFGEVLRAEALGLKCEDRPADFAGRSESVSCIFCWWDTAPAYIGEYPIPLACSLNTAARSHRKELRKCGRGKSGHLREKQCDPLHFAYKGEKYTNLVVDEKHYSCTELAQAWGVSPQTIRELFRKEEGVLKIGSSGTRTRRGYKTLRIPQSVAERVHGKLSA